jgi:3-oxoacyl-[acyl-carrier-protein] synthase II
MLTARMSERLRIAVTGVGVVSPIGFGREQFWRALCAGRSGIAPIERFPVAPGGPRLAAEVRGFAAREFIASAHLRRMDNLSRMLVAASRMALDDAGLATKQPAPEQVGIVVGSVLGDISESVTFLQRVLAKGAAAASPMVFPNLVLNASASYVAMELGLTGVNLTVSQGEISGELAIMQACDALRNGRAEMMLAGGADEVDRVVFDVYRRGRALSSQRGGAEWCSPYDAGRNGIVLGEGAAMLVLEPLRRAQARGAPVYAEIADYVSFGVVSPPYDWPARAAGALAPLLHCLNEAGESVDTRTGRRPGMNSQAESTAAHSSGLPEMHAIDLVCGSGNSSRRLDGCEIDLCAQLAAARNEPLTLTSIKGAVGEFGAAGALTTAAACLALSEQAVPPLCNLRESEAPDAVRLAPPCGAARALRAALVWGMARGGASAALFLHRATV